MQSLCLHPVHSPAFSFLWNSFRAIMNWHRVAYNNTQKRQTTHITAVQVALQPPLRGLIKTDMLRLRGFQQLLLVLKSSILSLIPQQISSCCISGRVGKGDSLKEKVLRPIFNSPWPGYMRYDPIKSSSGDGAGLSGSDSDWLVSGSSKEEAGLARRWGWEWGWGSGFSQGWLRPSSAVALFLYTQTQ